jgi:5-methylcytosine-specific restriction endonuclease McrA
MAQDAHHVLYTQRFPELADDPDNVVALCRQCHADHHAASHRLPRKIARHAALLAEGSPQRLSFIERTYTG